MKCKCGTEISRPAQTTVIIRDSYQVTENVYECPDCKAVHSVKKGKDLLSAPPVKFSFDVPTNEFQLPRDEAVSLTMPPICKGCGSEEAKLIATKMLMAGGCNKTIAEVQVFLCPACNTRYRKMVPSGRDGKQILNKILDSFPDPVKAHFEREVQ